MEKFEGWERRGRQVRNVAVTLLKGTIFGSWTANPPNTAKRKNQKKKKGAGRRERYETVLAGALKGEFREFKICP